MEGKKKRCFYTEKLHNNCIVKLAQEYDWCLYQKHEV